MFGILAGLFSAGKVRLSRADERTNVDLDLEPVDLPEGVDDQAVEPKSEEQVCLESSFSRDSI